MKKITFWLSILFAFVIEGVFAQGPAGTYAFSESTESYVAVSGTNSTATGDDGIQSAIPIGFTFNFDGTNYTDFGVSTNGWMKLGATAITTGAPNYTNGLSNSAANRPLIAAFWDDNHRNTGSMQYAVTGSAPNRILEVGWNNVNIGGSGATSATNLASYKIRLYETTNVIEIIYGPTMASAGSLSSSIGINGSSSFLSVTPGTPSTVSSSSANNSISSTTNVVGKKYIFTPPVQCAGTPVAGSVTPAAQSICVGVTPANLVANGFSSGVTGLTFQWQESDDNGVGDAWTDVATGTGATTSVYTPPAFSGTTIYYRLNVTCTPSGQSAQTASVVINPPNAPTTQVTNLAQGAATLTTIPLNWVNGNGTRRVVYFNSVNSFTDPVNGNAPANTAAAAYAGGEQIVYDGTGTAVTVTGLTAGTTYYAKVYEYTRCGAGPYDFYYNVSVGTNLLTVNTLSPPANDNFANAIAVTCGNTYNGNTASATLDEDNAPDGFGADMDAPNVWFSYTGSGTPQTVTLDLCGSAYDTSVLVYTGTSGALTLIGANDDEASCSAGGTRSKLNFTSDGTTTYYIAIEGWNAGNTGAFTMVTSCVSACTPAVANQTCATALSVSTNGVDVNSDNTCGDISTTQPSCDTFGTIQDVWFSFVGPANGIVDCVVTPLTMTSANFAIYSGADCNSLTLLTGTCNSDLTAATTEALTGLTPGQTYYIQVWSSTAEQGTFTLNLLSPVCINPSGILGNNLTDSSVDLSWNLTSGNYQYVLDNVATNPAGAGTDLVGEFYAASGLNVNTQYYFHVRTDCGSGSYSNWVTYSFTTLPTPPANNNCTGAVVLTPGGDFTAGEVTGTNVGATASEIAEPTIPAPSCASYSGGDVWYSAVVPASGSLTFEVNESVGGLTDTGGAVYSGACNSLALEGCNDSLSASGDHPLISLTGRTPGETLYFRVWEYGNNSTGTFRVSAYDASLSSDSFDLKGFKAYPNPVKDIFRISYVKEISSVAVYNLLGQEVLTQKVNALSSEINMTSLSKGTYLVKVTVDGLVNTVKVIKE